MNTSLERYTYIPELYQLFGLTIYVSTKTNRICNSSLPRPYKILGQTQSAEEYTGGTYLSLCLLNRSKHDFESLRNVDIY